MKKSRKKGGAGSSSNDCPTHILIFSFFPLLTFIYFYFFAHSDFRNFEENAVHSLHNLKEHANHELDLLHKYYDKILGKDQGFYLMNEYRAQNHQRFPGKKRFELVLGIVSGIQAEEVVTFVSSFREHNHNARVILFMDSLALKDPRIQEQSRLFKVEIEDISPSILTPPFLEKFDPSTYRWPIVKKFFEQRNQEEILQESLVLLADVRDILFQADPFAYSDFPAAPFILGFPTGQPLSAEGSSTAKLIEQCFGSEMRRNLRDQMAITSGIWLGSGPEVHRFVDLMTEIVTTPEFAHCEERGVDQAVASVLAHLGRVPNLRLEKPGETRLVVDIKAGDAQTDGKGLVYSASSLPAVMIHQYDHSNKLKEDIFRKYVYWTQSLEGQGAPGGVINPHDLRSSSNQVAGLDGAYQGEGECRNFYLRKDFDLFVKVCDFYVHRAKEPDQCCTKCDADPGCQALVFFDGICYMKKCKNRDLAAPVHKKGVVTAFKV